MTQSVSRKFSNSDVIFEIGSIPSGPWEAEIQILFSSQFWNFFEI